MAEDMEIQESEIILVDENGEECLFTLLDVVEIDGAEYAILQPNEEDADDDEDEDADNDDDDDDEEAEAIILKFEKDEDGKDILVEIDDDEEWEKVADAWQDAMEE